MLYIFWLLHQTTTSWWCLHIILCCISIDSYIKPQLNKRRRICLRVVYLLTPTSNHNASGYGLIFCFVVYLLTPTSNHNCRTIINFRGLLYIFWLLHQTTTDYLNLMMKTSLYIFWLLHQTTTYFCIVLVGDGCISFDSYIKPQLDSCKVHFCPVVYLLTPTSNHNLQTVRQRVKEVVYLLTPTSNHNFGGCFVCF